jgi:hypothetical protein
LTRTPQNPLARCFFLDEEEGVWLDEQIDCGRTEEVENLVAENMATVLQAYIIWVMIDVFSHTLFTQGQLPA